MPELSIDMGVALTIFGLAFAAWAWVVALGVRFLKEGIREMRESILIDLADTKNSVNTSLADMERHVFKELTDMRVTLTKTSETQNIHITQTERRLTMLETEFQFLKGHVFPLNSRDR